MKLSVYQMVMLISGLFLMLIAAFCCFVGLYPEAGIYREGLAVCGGIVLLLGAINLPVRQAVPTISLLALACMFVFFIQSKIIHYPYSAVPLQAMFYMLWCAILGFAVCQYKEYLGAEKFYRYVGLFLLAGGLISAIGSFVIASSGGLIAMTGGYYVIFNPTGGEISGPLSQSNQFATFLLCAMVSAAYVLQSGRYRFLFLFPIVIILAVVFSLTNSRVGVIEALALLAGFSLVLLVTRKNQFALNVVIACLLVIACLFFVPALVKSLGMLSESTSTLSRLATDKYGVVERSSMLRIEVWQRAWNIFLAHPIFGVGVGNFARADFLERVIGVGLYDQHALKFTHAHNIVLQFAAEMGVVGLGLLSVLFWNGFRLVQQAWIRKDYLLFPVAILMCLALHSMTEFPLWYVYLGGVFVLFSTDFPAYPLPERLRRFSSASLVIFSMCILAWGASITCGMYKIDAAYELAMGAKKPQQAATSVLNDPAINGMVAQYAEPFLTTIMVPNEDKEANLIFVKIAERVAEATPNVFFVYRLPLWQLSVGERDKAYASLASAYAMHPPGLESLVEARALSANPSAKKWIDELLEYAKNNLENKPAVKKWYSVQDAK